MPPSRAYLAPDPSGVQAQPLILHPIRRVYGKPQSCGWRAGQSPRPSSGLGGSHGTGKLDPLPPLPVSPGSGCAVVARGLVLFLSVLPYCHA